MNFEKCFKDFLLQEFTLTNLYMNFLLPLINTFQSTQLYVHNSSLFYHVKQEQKKTST
jgi:hypothetical protein